MHICFVAFAGISLRLCYVSLRSFRITFAAYLPTHIKSLWDFFQSSLNNHRNNLYIISYILASLYRTTHKSLPHENLKAQASEMPHHAKHHASENRRAIERSLVIAMHTQHEPRRGSVMIVKKEKPIP